MKRAPALERRVRDRALLGTGVATGRYRELATVFLLAEATMTEVEEDKKESPAPELM
jgi:hypothetical protein